MFVCIALYQSVNSQSFEILGKVETNTDLENIHVINKTAQIFTITNRNGEFKIVAKLNDTIMFSSLQNKPKTVVITKNILLFKALRVTLEEQINELDEVTIGKILTGNLLSDIQNVEGDVPINFYDVGIPGYTGKPATQNERRFNEAITGPGGQKLKWYSPLTGSIPLNPIMNAISGRTKELKNQIKLEEKEELMQSIKGRLAKDFFASNPMEEDLKMDFFYFCADDENFIKYCENQSDFKILIFLRQKHKQYMENLNPNKP
ncbi:hypothetical protein EV196_103480 [Mariniflexile fucanivorans]|uniref:Carboxypeptidase-like protein n=1 Tax=Mariniflexile fucanivorans TaxID=264023 RepID=A0A4V6NGX4_9FLAO|nr:carboxypeptidase-like regulatory domain-containing protein [Mariniflexile fucanivorans]TCL67057.1 hypothetical protein EV196_103480 [Mariniflexile fucanivorans]